MPLHAVDSRRLYRQIADQIAALIEKGEYGAGERLPPERNLAKQLGVSRPSVREALIALEVEGKVEVRIGSGVFVCPPHKLVVKPLDQGEGPFELIRARWVVEGETAALATESRTSADLDQMHGAIDDLRISRDAKE